MATADVIVIGGGISGLSLAWHAVRAGGRALVLERGGRVGGCFHSPRRDGFWFEMGAHTTYNSYGAFLDVVAGAGIAGKIVPRGPARTTFGLLRNGEYSWLTPPKVLLRLSWLEAALSFPAGILRSKEGQTVSSYYSRLVGRRNYERLLSAFLSAVPSQKADGFPVTGPGSLFKKRPRRQEFPRSFGIEGGLQSVCEAVAAVPGVAIERGVAAARVSRTAGGFAVTAADGRTFEAPRLAVAAPADEAARLLEEAFPPLAGAIGRVRMVGVESLGVVLPRARCWMPECAFVVPVDDLFYSAVTRDPFPDPARRAFAFHFRPGVARDDKLRRVAEVLRVSREELGEPVEQRLALPSPAPGHDAIVRDIDAALAGGRLAVTGNYFAGLAIEDCVLRSRAEWARISGLVPLPRAAARVRPSAARRAPAALVPSPGGGTMSRVRRLGAAVAVAAVAAAIAGAPAASAGPRRAASAPPAGTARTLLSGAVRYVLPARWIVQADVVGCGSEGVAVAIPCPALDATPHSADANLLALPNGEGEGLAAWSARRLAEGTPRRIVEERVEERWRTVVSTGEDRGVRYAVVERFGVAPAARVHAVAAFPVLAAVGEAWLAGAGAEIDRFLASIRVEGAPPSRVRVEWRGGALRLRQTPTPTPTSTSAQNADTEAVHPQPFDEAQGRLRAADEAARGRRATPT